MSLKKKNKIKQDTKANYGAKGDRLSCGEKNKVCSVKKNQRQRKVTFTRAILHCN
jgi:hypothetical protein